MRFTICLQVLFNSYAHPAPLTEWKESILQTQIRRRCTKLVSLCSLPLPTFNYILHLSGS